MRASVPPSRLEAVRILGIESSCDETAAAVVENGSRILSTVVSSQMATHAKYGGVVPELASREHLRAIVPVVRAALEEGETRLEDLSGADVVIETVSENAELKGKLFTRLDEALPKAVCGRRMNSTAEVVASKPCYARPPIDGCKGPLAGK